MMCGPDVPEVPVCGSLTTVEQGKHLFSTRLAARAWPCSESPLANCLLLQPVIFCLLSQQR